MTKAERILVLADVHANLAAFEAVLAAAGPVDECILLGDVVGFGPQPLQCLHLLQKLGERLHLWMVVGNHDLHALQSAPSWHEDAVGSDAYWEAWTAAQLDSPARAFLRGHRHAITETIHRTAVHLCHNLPNAMGYIDEATPEAELAEQLCGVAAELVLFAHSHLVIDRIVDGKRIVNCGSVGQPRDGCPRAAFAIWDAEGLSFHRVSYDVERTVAALDQIPMTAAYWEVWARNYRNGVAPTGASALSCGTSGVACHRECKWRSIR